MKTNSQTKCSQSRAELCLSEPVYAGKFISNIGTVFEKEIETLPKIVKDAAPYAAQLPVVGPAVGIGRAIGSEMGQAIRGSKRHVGQNPRSARYPLARHPVARYPPARHPLAIYPPSRYSPARYPPSRYQPAEHPPARYPSAEYPPARYPTSEYPPGGRYAPAPGYPGASSPIPSTVGTEYPERFLTTRRAGYSGVYAGAGEMGYPKKYFV
ncbi:adhesive plaque matrix protein-like [Belonocnema kinseyi]|uniref:adhesive plaque matrix protein-like n=1 Tax=Belonocnema kinseyi TaxID=2817044 RepID=UPI00143CC22F|nr:adhesive plaque matrix protein-like [Belonocnema kinseyi]